MICKECHKDLSEKDFYPSTLKRKWYICKKCYNKKTEPCRKKYHEELKNLVKEDFDRFYGGYEIKIINWVRKGEFKYFIKSTAGKVIQTNKKDEFINNLKKILDI